MVKSRRGVQAEQLFFRGEHGEPEGARGLLQDPLDQLGREAPCGSFFEESAGALRVPAGTGRREKFEQERQGGVLVAELEPEAELGPVTCEEGLDAVEGGVLAGAVNLTPLAKSPERAASVRGGRPGASEVLSGELGDENSALGIVGRRDAIEDLLGVVDDLGRDHVNREAIVVQLMS
jgi:hypothetical protein